MSVEPAQSNPSEVESKGSRDWIFMLPLCGVVAQLSQAAALGLASYRPRVKLWFLRNWALNFAGIAGAQLQCSSCLSEQKVRKEHDARLPRMQISPQLSS